MDIRIGSEIGFLFCTIKNQGRHCYSYQKKDVMGMLPIDISLVTDLIMEVKLPLMFELGRVFNRINDEHKL
jgi:hypothetical protein